MKKIAKLARKFEGKPRPAILKICLTSFLFSFLIGFCLGLVLRELRLNLFAARQKAQRIEEGRRLERISNKFPQLKMGELEGASPPPVKK